MVYLIVFLGLMLGSFTNALVWRIHEQTKKKNKNNQKFSILKGRSMCPHCSHTLSAQDLVPVLSWLALKGRCRYCKVAISPQYPVVELVAALLFGVSYVYWPYQLDGVLTWGVFMMWLVICVLFLALTVYDLKWLILPNRLVYPALVLSILLVGTLGFTEKTWSVIASGALGALLYGGFFYLLYQFSSGRWIGGGDVRLGFVLGTLLGWQKSLVSLTGAAYSACAVILVLVLVKKYHRNMKIPFGPFLITASIAAFLWGQTVIDFYRKISGL
jgi:prepilin signal peptidase PulO-like enzyme (type II secretory pathway)